MNYRVRVLSLSIAIVTLLTACASPLVTYTTVKGEDKEGKSKFKFSESIIQFTYKTDGAQLGPKVTGIEITSVPVPYGTNKTSLEAVPAMHNYGTKTTLNVTYRGDSDLVQAVSSEVTDQKVTWLQTGGSIIKDLIPFFVEDERPTGSLKLPKGIAVTTLLNSPPAQCTRENDGALKCTDVPLDGTSDYKADLDISAPPTDAFSISADEFEKGYSSKAFIYSACRQMTISLKSVNKAGKLVVASQATLQVADPSKFEALRFPDKGTITAGVSCGASVTNQSSQLPNALDYTDALISQASAVKAALDKQKSSGTGQGK